MSRPLRIEFEHASYHVTARGNERRPIFFADADRTLLLDSFGEMAQRFGLLIHAYCLMPNHYHLLVQTPRANLSQAMGWLQTAYSVRVNRRHRRSGHLFQARFKATLIDADEYARCLIPYVHLNPVRPRDHRKPVPADRRRFLDSYPFSSHRAYAGLEKDPPPWLSLQWLDQYFADPRGGRTRAQAQYRQAIGGCFGQVLPSPWDQLRGGLVLGSAKLWERARRLLGARSGQPERAWASRHTQPQLQQALKPLLAAETDPRVRIWLRVQVGAQRMSDVARELGYADGSGVLRVVQRLEQAAESDRPLRRKLASLRDAALAASGLAPPHRQE